MKLSSAARKFSVSFLISSSLAPRSSACLSASCAARNALSTSVMLPSSMVTASAHRLATTSRNASSLLGLIELPGDAVEAEILAGLGREQFRRDHQRIQRDMDLRALVGVERQDAALLDQRARQRLGEQPLGQPHVERLAAPLIAGLVLGRQGQRHIGAGIRILAEVLDGLADAVAGPRIRQSPAQIAARRTTAALRQPHSARRSSKHRLLNRRWDGPQNAPALR